MRVGERELREREKRVGKRESSERERREWVRESSERVDEGERAQRESG